MERHYVICLDGNRSVFATHRWFPSFEEASKYADTISADRAALVVTAYKDLNEPYRFGTKKTSSRPIIRVKAEIERKEEECGGKKTGRIVYYSSIADQYKEKAIKGCPMGRGHSPERSINDLIRRTKYESCINLDIDPSCYNNIIDRVKQND